MARWPGRLQILSERPLLFADGAHNPAAAGVLAQAIEDEALFARARTGPLAVVLGVLSDKDAAGIAAAFAPRAAAVVCVAPATPPALSAEPVGAGVGPNGA